MTLMESVAISDYTSNMPSSIAKPRIADKSRIPIDTAKIRKLRLSLGLSMADAAARAGLPGRQRWYHIESGRLRNPTLSTIERVAKVLGVHARDLLK